jgi:ERAP1-like C-terminal domain
LNDTWALVRSGREPVASYLRLATRLRADSSYAVVDQIAGALWFIDGLARGYSEREAFRQWARQLLVPQLEELGWTARSGETALDDLRRNAVIRVLGGFGDESVLREARDRFKRSLEKPESLTGDLRDTVWWLVGRGADEATYGQLHALAKKTESIEQKRNLYAALGAALSPALARQTLDLSLTDELPPQHAARLVPRVAGGGEHMDLAWNFAREHFEALRAKLSFFQARDYVPDIFDHFSDAARADELEEWTRRNLPPDAATLTARTAEAIRFKAALKERLLPQIGAWCRENPQP